MFVQLFPSTTKEKAIGTITYHVSPSPEEQYVHLTISHLSTHERGKGYGYFLMLLAFYDAFSQASEQRLSKMHIELDDMSDRFLKDHNIYRSMGFQYIQHGYPEMTLTIPVRSFHHYFRSMIQRIRSLSKNIDDFSFYIHMLPLEDEQKETHEQYAQEYLTFFK
jgi:hypothetical protein